MQPRQIFSATVFTANRKRKPFILIAVITVLLLLATAGVAYAHYSHHSAKAPAVAASSQQQTSATTSTPSAGTQSKTDESKNTSSGTTKSDSSTTKSTSGTTNTGGSGSSTSGGSSGTTGSGSSGGTTLQTTNCAPSPHLCGYPDATNTGPSGCSSYTNYSGTYTVSANGTVVSCLNLTGVLDIEASNVTIQNSILNGNSWWGVRMGVTNSNATNLKLLHNKLQTAAGQGPDSGGYDYGVAPQSTGTMEIAYNDISGYKDGIDISSGSIHDNYIHALSRFTGAHTQDIYVYAGGSGTNISHNTLINDSPLAQATAAVYIAPDDGHQNGHTVTNNLLAGGANTLYGGDSTATNIVVTNNAFSTSIFANSGYYGTDAYWQAGNAGNTWSGNTWNDGPNVGKTVSP